MRTVELARSATLNDPATPTALGVPVELRRPLGRVTLAIEADGVTGTVSPSLTIRLQGSNDLTTWTDLGNGIVVSAANTNTVEAVDLPGAFRFVRAAVTAKAGTTPGLTGVEVSLLGRGLRA